MDTKLTTRPEIWSLLRTKVVFDIPLTVPFGDLHICFSLNSSTRASSGVIVAHLMPTLYFWIALADSTVTSSLV
jgi:hypothetical protein